MRKENYDIANKRKNGQGIILNFGYFDLTI